MSARLQKIIAAAGIASRRKAELLIKAGRVTVNGTVVTTLGSKADEFRDYIKVDGKLIRTPGRSVYVLLNKPRGVISTVSDPAGRVKVIDLVPVKEKLFPVGRLDYNTEGLILLTNDGEFAKTISAAGPAFPKVYQAKVRGLPEESTLARLRSGGRLPDGTRLSPCKIRILKAEQNAWLEVTLTEGKNREIRKMFDAFHHPVLKLRRVRIGFLTAAGLPVGHYRLLTPREVDRVRKKGSGAFRPSAHPANQDDAKM